jgi:Fe-S-cluster containining protein
VGGSMSCFYADGLQFSCQPECRYCCGVEPGYVFLTPDDIDRLVTFLHLDIASFLQQYCRKVPMGSFHYISLIETAQHDCIFLGEHGCTVYEGRPIQCATYPFWNTVLENRQTWEQEATWCPGIGKGRLYSRDEIDQLLHLREGVEVAIWESYTH